MKFVVTNRHEAEKIMIPQKHIWISINDSDEKPALLPQNAKCLDILKLSFDDVNEAGDLYILNSNGKFESRKITSFTPEMAQKVLDFFHLYKDYVDIVAVHCHLGQCRSPGIAAALQKITTGEDGDWFKIKTPNSLVYRTILNQYYNPENKSAFEL